MWVRSQTKGDVIGELVPITNKLSIVRKHNRATLEDKYLICHKEDILGTYNSKERALEVLDEIQKLLIEIPRTEILFNNIVYQMPKE